MDTGNFIALAGLGVVVIGGVWRLLTLASNLGATAQRIETAQASLERKVAALDVLPALVVRVGQLEHAVGRCVSDISELKETVGEHRGRLDSIPEA